jgi:Fe-S cluster assembly iron-binding protein IscA
MALDESKGTTDSLYNFDKVKVVINQKAIDMIGKTKPLKIDFIKNEYQEGFTIDSGSNC